MSLVAYAARLHDFVSELAESGIGVPARLVDLMVERANTLESEVDLKDFIRRQREFSERAFGAGDRTVPTIAHIRAELEEIEADPDDIVEWIDVVLLAMDGARRLARRLKPDEPPEDVVAEALEAKLAKNVCRKWPPIDMQSLHRPAFHIKQPKD